MRDNNVEGEGEGEREEREEVSGSEVEALRARVAGLEASLQQALARVAQLELGQP
jgi:hypothetical protein